MRDPVMSFKGQTLKYKTGAYRSEEVEFIDKYDTEWNLRAEL